MYNRQLSKMLLNVYISVSVLGMGSLEPSGLSSYSHGPGGGWPLLPILKFPDQGSWATHLEAPKWAIRSTITVDISLPASAAIPNAEAGARGEEAVTSCPALERGRCYSLPPGNHPGARFPITLGPSRQGRRPAPCFHLAPLHSPPSVVRANSRKPNHGPRAGDSGWLLARARRWLPRSVATGRCSCCSETEAGAPLVE